jgi:GntR family transcriptional regulator
VVASRISRTEEVESALLARLHELAGHDGRLPTEGELAAMFNVSRTTVRSAVGALVARGLIVRRQGLGSFVSQARRIANPLDEALDFSEIIRRNGCTPSIKYLNAEVVTVDQPLAALLNLTGRLALQRRAIYFADDEPVIYCINTIPGWVLSPAQMQELAAVPAVSEPIYDFLAQACGQRVELSPATIWSAVARTCGLPEHVFDPSTPLLVIEEVGYNTANQPVLHSLEHYPGRSMRFELVRRRTLKV